jgi:hypothetical protein
MHERTISDAGFVKVEGGAVTNDRASPCLDTGGTRKIRLRRRCTPQLAVGRAARAEEEHCTCTAVAYFGNDLLNYCAWSSPSTSCDPSLLARNHSTVMVGLPVGTVHFMEFRV